MAKNTPTAATRALLEQEQENSLFAGEAPPAVPDADTMAGLIEAAAGPAHQGCCGGHHGGQGCCGRHHGGG